MRKKIIPIDNSNFKMKVAGVFVVDVWLTSKGFLLSLYYEKYE